MKHSVDRNSQEKRLQKTVYVKIVNGLKLLSAFLLNWKKFILAWKEVHVNMVVKEGIGILPGF